MRGKLLTVLGAAAIGAGGVRVARNIPRLGQARGDDELIADVRRYVKHAGGLRHRLSIAVIEAGQVRQAHFGADSCTEYEIGSVTKTFTGALLAQLINTGAVSERTALSHYFDLASFPAGAITLAELATHHSGLPRDTVALSKLAMVKHLVATSDPARRLRVGDLVEAAKSAELTAKVFAYSNLGFALLGAALAAECETPYGDLVHHQIARPLQLTGTYVPTQASDVPREALGYTLIGRRCKPYTLGAEAPAGAIRSTLSDMVRYLQAHIDASAPGVGACTARAARDDGNQVGFGWMVDGPVCWHNGASLGHTSWVGFDRQLRVGVVVLNDTAYDVDELGESLMQAARNRAGSR